MTVDLDPLPTKNIKLTACESHFLIPTVNFAPFALSMKKLSIYLVRDCEGFSCYIAAETILWISVLLSNFLLFEHIDSKLHLLFLIAFLNSMTILASISHFKSMTTNPVILIQMILN